MYYIFDAVFHVKFLLASLCSLFLFYDGFCTSILQCNFQLFNIFVDFIKINDSQNKFIVKIIDYIVWILLLLLKESDFSPSKE